MSESRRGLGYGVAAYLLWGLFPLFWPLLRPARPLEILAHRFVWSLVFVLVILVIQRRWAWIGILLLRPRRLALLVAAAVLIAVNWGTYIYGVNSGQVVQTSLGYFINPLVTVLLAVIVLRERLRPGQWAALGVGGVAVVLLALGYGRVPWIALILAFSFGTYSLIKKVISMDPVQSLTVETAALVVPAVIYLAVIGGGSFAGGSLAHDALLVSSGVVTAIPLLFFGAAARRLPLRTLGLLQYLGPALQFAFGVLVFHEPMPLSRLAGFALVWTALVILTAEGLAHRRRAIDPVSGQDVAAGEPGPGQRPEHGHVAELQQQATPDRRRVRRLAQQVTEGEPVVAEQPRMQGVQLRDGVEDLTGDGQGDGRRHRGDRDVGDRRDEDADRPDTGQRESHVPGDEQGPDESRAAADRRTRQQGDPADREQRRTDGHAGQRHGERRGQAERQDAGELHCEQPSPAGGHDEQVAQGSLAGLAGQAVAGHHAHRQRQEQRQGDGESGERHE